MTWWRNTIQWKKVQHSRQQLRWKISQGWKNTVHPATRATQATKIHIHYPLSIEVKHPSNSHVSSSVPGLSSYLDMSMTEISPENQVTMVRKCVQKHMFSIWKFYHKENHAHDSQDERTICGFLLKNTNLRGNHNWWLEMQKVVIKTHTDVRSNAIICMQTKSSVSQNKETC